MKRLAAIVILGCLLAVTASAYAGDWRVSGYVGGAYVSTRGVGGGFAHVSDPGKLMRPGAWPHHHPGWHAPIWYPPSPFGWGPSVYYDAPVYVVTPWVDSGVTVITGSGVGYGYIVEESPVIRTPGMYAISSGLPSVGAYDRGPGVPADLEPPLAWTSPERPRRNLDGILRVFAAGGVDRVETELGKLVRSNPSDAELSYIYSCVLFLREKYATASFVLRRALMLDAELTSLGRPVLGGFYDAGRTAEGLARMNRYVETNPGDASVRLVRAYVLFLDGRRDAAREDLAVVLKADPADQEAARLLSRCTLEGKTSPPANP